MMDIFIGHIETLISHLAIYWMIQIPSLAFVPIVPCAPAFPKRWQEGGRGNPVAGERVCETFFFCFPPSSVACVLSLHRTAEMSRSVVAVARLLGRSRLAAPTCSVPSLNLGIGGIVVDDGSVLCERHTIMNGRGALSGGQAAWGSIHQVPSRAFSDDHTAKWMQVFPFFFFFPFLPPLVRFSSRRFSILEIWIH